VIHELFFRNHCVFHNADSGDSETPVIQPYYSLLPKRAKYEVSVLFSLLTITLTPTHLKCAIILQKKLMCKEIITEHIGVTCLVTCRGRGGQNRPCSVQFSLFSSIKSITSSRELLDIELVITIYIYIHIYTYTDHYA
jgi:hypothetical protein